MSSKTARRIPKSGVYVVKAAEGRSRSVQPSTSPLKPARPSKADKALVAALRSRLS